MFENVANIGDRLTDTTHTHAHIISDGLCDSIFVYVDLGLNSSCEIEHQMDPIKVDKEWKPKWCNWIPMELISWSECTNVGMFMHRVDLSFCP